MTTSPPRVDAYALAAFLDVKPATIHKWAERGHITRLGTSPQGWALYDFDQAVLYAQTRRTRQRPNTTMHAEENPPMVERKRRHVELVKTNGWWQIRETGIRVIASTRYEDTARLLLGVYQQAAATLDEHLPLLGPCLICSVPGEDQSHRVIDAIADRVAAMEDERTIAEDYGIPVVAVEAAFEWVAAKRAPAGQR